MLLFFRVSLWIVCSLFLLISVLFLSGCGPKYKSYESESMPTYCKPELTYLLSDEYTRLYVEVDRTEDVEIPEGLLDELKVFLEKYCDKPGGVEIVLDDVISAEECKEVSGEYLGTLYVDGPQSGILFREPAFMYILFYDSSKMGKQLISAPHVPRVYYSSIFYDRSYLPIIKNRGARSILLHEAGHLLGLNKNPEHDLGDGAHCGNRGCLMSTQSITLILLGKKYELCDDCKKDIEKIKVEKPSGKMSFDGPFLVRREKDYWVASLLQFDFVSLSPRRNFAWEKMLPMVKKQMKLQSSGFRKDPRERLWAVAPYDIDDSPEAIKRELERLRQIQKDPNSSVSFVAKRTIEKIKKRFNISD